MIRQVEWTEGRTLFRDLAESAKLIAWICEPDGYCVYLSPAWHACTGKDGGHGFDWLQEIHPSDRAVTVTAFFEAISSQTEYVVSSRLRRPDGTFTQLLARGMPHRAADGRYMGVVGFTDPVREANLAPTPDRAERSQKLLTPREREILKLLCTGMEAESIAKKLGVSKRTVGAHFHNALLKLQAKNRTHACIRALELCEISMPENT